MGGLRLSSVILACIAVVGLSGCDQLGQVANEAVDHAKQTAAQALDEARQAGSIEEAARTADTALQDVKQQAAGLLRQASDYLSENQQSSGTDRPAADAGPATKTKTDG